MNHKARHLPNNGSTKILSCWPGIILNPGEDSGIWGGGLSFHVRNHVAQENGQGGGGEKGAGRRQRRAVRISSSTMYVGLLRKEDVSLKRNIKQ